MKNVLILIVTLAIARPATAWAQEAAARSPSSQEEDHKRDLEIERRTHLWIEFEDRSGDLWYGTPGVRVGGDLLMPVIDLIRQPSNLLDFRPRSIPRYLPDRETMEFLRERR
jgi:hypothetical protein